MFLRAELVLLNYYFFKERKKEKGAEPHSKLRQSSVIPLNTTRPAY